METRARGFHGATCVSAVREQEERAASRKKRLQERFADGRIFIADQFGGSVFDGNDLIRLCEFHETSRNGREQVELKRQARSELKIIARI